MSPSVLAKEHMTRGEVVAGLVRNEGFLGVVGEFGLLGESDIVGFFLVLMLLHH